MMKLHMLPVGPIQANCYILCDEEEKKCAVIDPGGEGAKVARAVKLTDCEPVAVYLTHGHYDHTGGVEELREFYPDVPVYINCRDQHADSKMWQLCPTIPNTKSYDEGDVLTVGSLKIEVLATPGHSGGSVTLKCGECLFTGDTLFAGSCGRTDFPDGSMQTIMASLQRLGQLEGDWQVLPGHMEYSTMEAERRRNPFLRQALGKGYFG